MPVFTQPAVQGKFIKGRRKREQEVEPSIQVSPRRGDQAAKDKSPLQPVRRTKDAAE